jgi:hypothetical protein
MIEDDDGKPLSFSTEELILAQEAEQHEGEQKIDPNALYDLEAVRPSFRGQPGWLPLKLRTDI